MAVLLLLLDIVAVTRVLNTSGGGRIAWTIIALALSFGLVAVLALLRGLVGMRYILGRRGLTVESIGSPRLVPYEAMLDIVYKPRERVPNSGWERYWPGFYVSTTRMVDGVWHSWATQPRHRRVRIVTAHEIIAISPHRPILFIDELNRRRGLPDEAPELGEPPSAAPAEVVLPPSPATPVHAHPTLGYAWHVLFRQRLLGDQSASALIAAGVVLPLLMAGYLFSQYEGLPGVIHLHYNARGEVDSIGEPRDLWLLPIVCAVIFVLNTTLATLAELFDAFVSRLLLVATPAVQVLAFIALVRLMNAG